MVADDRFSVFFSNDKFDTAGAQQLGFDGFFRGAYSYHFHNFWYVSHQRTELTSGGFHSTLRGISQTSALDSLKVKKHYEMLKRHNPPKMMILKIMRRPKRS
jgi:hypothetical protein